MELSTKFSIRPLMDGFGVELRDVDLATHLGARRLAELSNGRCGLSHQHPSRSNDQ